ncbi:hypothetical protein HYPSUDRAFT_56481 [Hypholoma sublateritium FD-334 SS-4]|uniref:Ig-like domain-containing protein n=1 Tax=Hypholoma sublateritium (strain FD-334 SS-4) TaxID=945553 RepID=A0A0D2M8X8_HYPSF|nr:hypothetical protein HYPSUDRAFT_56481 [Hypholoma sublateritium FD-334 SS-4]
MACKYIVLLWGSVPRGPAQSLQVHLLSPSTSTGPQPKIWGAEQRPSRHESGLHPQQSLCQHVADGDMLDPTEAPRSVSEMSVARSALRLTHALYLHCPLALALDAACKNGPPVAIARVARKRLEHGDAGMSSSIGQHPKYIEDLACMISAHRPPWSRTPTTAQSEKRNRPTVLIKWLNEATAENSHLKLQLSQAAEENRTLLLNKQQDLQDRHCYDTLRLQSLLDGAVAKYNESVRGFNAVKEERDRFEAEVADMKTEINRIWVQTARICRGDRAAEQLERELGLS